jgi:hypothetical protein
MTGTEIDFGDLGLTHAQDTAVREVLVQRENKRRRQCQARMRLAAYCQSERRLLGDGEVKMQVDPYSYHYWGQRLGYQCWQDPEFVEEYLRDNPESRIRSRPDKLTIVAPDRLSISELASHKRFQKTYDLEPNWIAGAIKHPGALHRQMGVRMGQKIPASRLRSAARKGGKMGARARLAMTLRRMHKY